MDPQLFYNNNLQRLQLQSAALLKKKSMLAWSRFIAVAAMIAALYFLWPVGHIYAAGAAIAILIVFVQLLLADLRNKKRIEHTKSLLAVNEAELKALVHQYTHFEDGAALIPAEHPYANDLDILGRASLFQYCNRTNSEMGAAKLAEWLLYPAGKENILLRQQAVKELMQYPDWRQQLQAYGKEKKITTATSQRLQEWLQQPNTFINSMAWRLAQFILPIALLTIITLNIFDVVNDHTRNYFLLGAAITAFFISRKIAALHAQVSKIAAEMDVLEDCVRLIEHTKFETTLLQQLQHTFNNASTKTSTEIQKLKKILERLDLRLNPVVFIPLDIIFQWDLQQGIALEKWKKRNRQNIGAWFASLAEFEALNSFAVLGFNHPGWCFPVLHDEHFFITGMNIGHPLIAAAKRVNNPININEKGELMLVTGSNMAGKSTYLRSIGINVVLTMAGAPVCADSFTVSPVQLISSMRIADNLEESTSTFYAELKKLKAVIDKVNAGEKIFILLDEILRGTNSLDRHTGSAALIRQLIKHEAAAIIATHDVELAKLQEEYPGNILNYHFDVQVNNEELYFDYKLKPGICTSLNASILMRKIGIELTN